MHEADTGPLDTLMGTGTGGWEDLLVFPALKHPPCPRERPLVVLWLEFSEVGHASWLRKIPGNGAGLLAGEILRCWSCGIDLPQGPLFPPGRTKQAARTRGW